jgi:hypothetical protein
LRRIRDDRVRFLENPGSRRRELRRRQQIGRERRALEAGRGDAVAVEHERIRLDVAEGVEIGSHLRERLLRPSSDA